MKITRKLAFYGLILVSTFFLNACGGEKATVNESKDRPHFEWVNAVVGTDITPLGDISTTTPEFTWKFNRRTINSAKFKIGFEKTDGTGWQEYEIRQDTGVVTCINPTDPVGNSRVCSATLPNHEFSPGDEIAWWVAYDTRSGWFWQLDAYVFNVAGGSGGGNSSTPQPISPMGSSSSQPVFEWETVNADNFTIGLEKPGGSWQEFNVNGKLNCPAQQRNEPYCWRSDYRLPISALSAGDYSWWIRADGKAWSNGAYFTVEGSGGGSGGSTDLVLDVEYSSFSGEPLLYWTRVDNFDDFELSYEVEGNTDWLSFKVGGSDAFSTRSDRHRYDTASHVSKMNVSAGDTVTWWIRVKVNGAWQDWSVGNTFTVK